MSGPVDMNGFLCCGHAWPSSWCGHDCGRAFGHDDADGHWCGWCGNPEVKVVDGPDGRDGRLPPPDFIETEGCFAHDRPNLSIMEKARVAPRRR